MLVVLGVGAMLWITLSVHRKARHAALMAAPFPASWSEILTRNLPPYPRLPQGLRDKLHGYINVFLGTKNFEGCGGQEIDDEVRVTIAAQACLLLIGRGGQCFPKLRSVLVYPHTYVARGKGGFGGVEEAPSVRLGESWQSGAVVLSWNSVKGGATNFDDGQNVTLHEFAHQLDQEDGAADGTPILDGFSCYGAWAHVLGGEYQSLLKRVDAHRKTVMDRYGATNPAEFFAVASETFFEKPEQLLHRQPELFEALKGYYKLDPIGWS